MKRWYHKICGNPAIICSFLNKLNSEKILPKDILLGDHGAVYYRSHEEISWTD